MKQHLFCRDNVRRLLQALLQDPDPQRIAAIVKQEPFPPRVPLSYALGERLSTLYYNALNKLARELVPQHAPRDELGQAFWELFGEVAAEASDYRIRGILTNRLNKFAEEWKRPLKLFEVAYMIENLNLGTETFSFGQACFFTMKDDELIQWGVSKDRPIHSRIFDDFSNHCVATIKVQASDSSRAFETGLQEVLAGLDLLRIAGVRGTIYRLWDEMFLWKLDGAWLARQIEDENESITQGWWRPFHPLIVDMAENIEKGLNPQNGNLQAIANKELPQEINNHLERAIRWISSSVTREQLDDKIIDLCTALEIMLLPDYNKGPKGQMLDLRHHLMGGTWEPGGILQLYELRSQIVHGSALNVSRYSDYWYLLLMCFEALRILVSHAKRNPQIQTLEGLIKNIETKEKLEDFIDHFKRGIFKGKLARQVKQVAKQRLKDLQKG
jgi:hypothetical protein